MRQRLIVAAILGFAILGSFATIEAGQRHPTKRWERGSFADYIIINRNGHTRVRQVYNGYIYNWPAPAFLYYQYPHSGYTYGIGF